MLTENTDTEIKYGIVPAVSVVAVSAVRGRLAGRVMNSSDHFVG